MRVITVLVCIIAMITGCIKDKHDGISEADNMGPGAAAKGILSDEKFDKLNIEFLVMPGTSISQDVYADVKEFLGQYVNKPAGIQLFETPIESLGLESYSLNNILDIEESERENFSSEREFSISVLVVDGEYEQPNVLGIAYKSSSIALMGGTVSENSGGLFRPSARKLYAAVLRHEMGHLMGLVDNGSPMVKDHLDREHGAHCLNESCLMYFSTETIGFLTGLADNPIPEFDEDCLNDLKANGGK